MQPGQIFVAESHGTTDILDRRTGISQGSRRTAKTVSSDGFVTNPKGSCQIRCRRGAKCPNRRPPGSLRGKARQIGSGDSTWDAKSPGKFSEKRARRIPIAPAGRLEWVAERGEKSAARDVLGPRSVATRSGKTSTSHRNDQRISVVKCVPVHRTEDCTPVIWLTTDCRDTSDD